MSSDHAAIAANSAVSAMMKPNNQSALIGAGTEPFQRHS